MAQAIEKLRSIDYEFPDDRGLMLKYHSSYTTITDNIEVEEYIGTRYIGDLYGILSYFKIPAANWLNILRLNGFTSPSDYDGQAMTLQIRSIDAVAANVAKELEGW